MSSIGRHDSPRTIYTQIKMLRQVRASTFLLMEGGSDIMRFRQFVRPKDCELINCSGKENVIGAIEISQNSGFEDCLGFVDADFERIASPDLQDDDDIVRSGLHDFDLDTACTDVFERYLATRCDKEKFAVHGSCENFVNALMLALKPLSVMRYANVHYGLQYLLSNVTLEAFFDGVSIDYNAMINHVSSGQFNTVEHRTTLQGHIDHFMGVGLDLKQITNGHDFFAAAGIALRDHVGSMPINLTTRTEVERRICLALEHADLLQTVIPFKVQEWEQRTGRIIWLHAQPIDNVTIGTAGGQ